MRFLFILLFLLNFAVNLDAQSKLIYTWEDDFTEAEKEKVQTWLGTTYKAVQAKIGEYPFDVYLHIHLKENKGEPCPWANTWRYPKQQIFFHIDPSYPLEDFLNDWTAPHEMSHLAIPYIGEKEAWFAEGFASFMQYQVMIEMGIMTKAEADSAYQSKFSGVEEYFENKNPIGPIAVEKREERNYKAMYWGGANLFFQWNQQLIEKQQQDFCSLFPAYLECCRRNARGVDGVTTSLDEVLGSTIGMNLLQQFREEPSKSTFLMPIAQ
jgi:hypothetical protein